MQGVGLYINVEPSSGHLVSALKYGFISIFSFRLSNKTITTNITHSCWTLAVTKIHSIVPTPLIGQGPMLTPLLWCENNQRVIGSSLLA